MAGRLVRVQITGLPLASHAAACDLVYIWKDCYQQMCALSVYRGMHCIHMDENLLLQEFM